MEFLTHGVINCPDFRVEGWGPTTDGELPTGGPYVQGTYAESRDKGELHIGI